MMIWNSPLTQLRDILQVLYPTLESTYPIVDDAGIPRDNISFSTAAGQNWHAILQEAHKHGKVLALVEVVLQQYPDNDDLRNGAQAYHDAFVRVAGSQQLR